MTHITLQQVANRLSRGQEIDGWSEKRGVPVPLRPGEFVLWRAVAEGRAGILHRHSLSCNGLPHVKKSGARGRLRVRPSSRHVRLAHFSAPNDSGDRRLGVPIRYMPPTVSHAQGGAAMLV